MGCTPKLRLLSLRSQVLNGEGPWCVRAMLLCLAQVLNKLVSGAVVTTWAEGDLITEQGSTGTRLYVVLSGEADVFKQQAERVLPHGTLVASLRPGDYFGERSVMSGEPRSFSVAARSEVRGPPPPPSLSSSSSACFFRSLWRQNV